jgi:hypothetical protein
VREGAQELGWRERRGAGARLVREKGCRSKVSERRGAGARSAREGVQERGW